MKKKDRKNWIKLKLREDLNNMKLSKKEKGNNNGNVAKLNNKNYYKKLLQRKKGEG